MKDSYEVIVVGAGPAGVAAALICRKKGYNVLLLDKKKKEKIGDKVCGEAISKKTVLKAMEKLSIAPPLEEEIKAQIEDLVLRTALPKNHITFPAIGYMIDRHMFGQRLLQEAIKSGVILKDQYRVKKPIVIDNKVSGVLIKDSEHNSIEILSKMVIDCSGTMAVVRTGLPQEYEPNLNKKVTKADFAPCYREIIQLNHDHDLEGKIVLQYEIDIPEPGYIWFFDEGEKRLNCGTGFIKQGKHATKSVKSVYFNALEKYFPKGTYKTIDGRGDVVPIRAPLWNAVGNGLIVAGDAAFHADPLTAEGHGPALMAGSFAGEVACNALEQNSFELEDLWEYNRLIVKEFGSDHARNRILTIVLEKIGPEKLEFLLKRKVVKQSDLTSAGIMKKRSFMDYLGRVVRCFPKYGLLLTMRKAISTSKAIAKHCEIYPTKPESYEVWKSKILDLYSQVT